MSARPIAAAAGARALADAGAHTEPPSDAEIHDRIVEAILHNRLTPGTKLVEDKLGQAFGVSRTRIRQVLIRLAHAQLVTLTPNRGAMVARPDPAEAREVFDVRRLIEPPLIEAFIARPDAGQLDALAAMIDGENAARRRGDPHGAIRLSGEFHLLIAEHSGHRTLARMLRELVSRTSLILMSYPLRPALAGQDHSACRCDEHRALLAAIKLRDSRAASRLMKQHLRALEAQFEFEAADSPAPDLVTLFGPR